MNSCKRNVYDDMCILPVTTYELGTMTLTKSIASKRHVAQRTIEHAMLCISLRDNVFTSLKLMTITITQTITVCDGLHFLIKTHRNL